MVSNIGGAAAYPNVRDYLLDIQYHGDIPDLLIIQEPGSVENYDDTVLEPFFSEFLNFGKIRIHYNPSTRISTSKRVAGTDGVVFDCNIDYGGKSVPIVFIGAYRNHGLSKGLFYLQLSLCLQQYVNHHFIVAGDFNTHPDHPELVEFMDIFELRSTTTSTHQHRSSDKASQIDYVLTNLPSRVIATETSYSLEK